jgi:epoxyqueuosine reductase
MKAFLGGSEEANMPESDVPIRSDRREFLRIVASAGTLICLGAVDALAADPAPARPAAAPGLDLRFRTVSARHVRELGEWFERLKREQRLSTNATYRRYIGGFRFAPPKEIPRARALVVAAVRQQLLAVTFHPDGGPRDVLIPTGYASQSYTGRDIRARLLRDALGGRGLLQRGALPLKTLAVHSGLARYGRNNIAYVEDFGSFHELAGYWTDQDLPDHWQPLTTLRMCKGCSICVKACPTRAFSETNFTIDAGRCLTLYNEQELPFPAWIPLAAHHTLIGCLRCQYRCPANADFIHDVERIADLDREQTRFILSGRRDPKQEKAITDLMPRYQVGYAHFARAARLALANGPVLG